MIRDKRMLELLKNCYSQIYELSDQGWGEPPGKEYMIEELGLSEYEYTYLEWLVSDEGYI